MVKNLTLRKSTHISVFLIKQHNETTSNTKVFKLTDDIQFTWDIVILKSKSLLYPLTHFDSLIYVSKMVLD